ncbi:MAG: MFS transporter [Truepera sp.]|nr:MFS transporter [Truepera sp.]
MMAAMPFRLPDLGPDKRRLLGSGFLAFGLVGMALSLYGPAFPALQGRFDIGAQAVGLIVSLHFLGGFVAVVTIGPVIARLGYRRPLASAAVGSAGVALGPGWELVLIGAFLLGLGLGFLDMGLNLLLVRSFDKGGAPVLNLLYALFGLGPALMAAFIPRFGPPFALVSFPWHWCRWLWGSPNLPGRSQLRGG